MQATTQRTALASVSGFAILAAVLCGCSGTNDSGALRRTAAANANAGAGTAAGSGGKGADGFGNAATPGGAGGATSGLAGTPAVDLPMTCAQGEANTSPVTPTVWLVLDGSGSMNEAFGGSTRWQALRAALMDPGGVVDKLQHNVRFGMVLYSGAMGGATTAAECVQLVTVQPALDNYSTLSAQYPAKELGGSTPTDKALDTVVTTLPVTNADQAPDAKAEPVYVILATDGAPNDLCSDTGGMRGRGNQFDPVVAQRVLDVVGKGVQMGMKMFVISLAGSDTQLAMHLQDVAAASGTGKPPFTPAGKDDLVAALQQIIGNASCQIHLDGSVAAGHECSGEVQLNGNTLTCGSTDGWMLTNPSTVQLAGTACSNFLQTDSMVHAMFPCDAFSPD